MRSSVIFIFSVIVFLSACKQEQEQQVVTESENPFFAEFNTPFNVPPFEKIDTSHYIPAFKKGIEEQQAEVDAIIASNEEPTFENTIVPYDQSGRLLKKVSNVFYSLNSANTNPSMQNIAREVAPLVTDHRDNIVLNEKLFQRIKSVYGKMDEAGLDDLQKRVLGKYYNDFVRNGADLNFEDKEKLRAINQELATLRLQFDENQLAETNTNFKLIIEDEKDLAGLPQEVKEAASITARDNGLEGKWVFTLQKPSMIPFLQYADNRDLREKIYRGYFMRGNNDNTSDNKEVMRKIVNLRSEKA
ncbi:MAG: peptidase M3, partial [Bacteroidota bacterium]